MHLCFIDIAAAYDADTPWQQALGGTQAAVCYLSAALARQGVPVTLINQKREAGTVHGVAQLPPEALDDPAVLKKFSAFIVNGRWTEKLLRALKKKTAAPLWAWMHEACFQTPHILPLAEFSGFVFVSAWQQKLNAPLVPPGAKSRVIPNGIAPAFQALFSPPLEGGAGGGVERGVSQTVAGYSSPQPPDPTPLIPSLKGRENIAAYAGSSRRGLLLLPEIIPLLRQKIPELVFEIYNDGVVGLDEKENHAFREKLRALPGVAHLGAVSQSELAPRLQRATYFLSPNTYPETFCIALAEAMAAGCFCIATARAALPETAHGFAALLPVDKANDPDWRPETLTAQTFSAFAAAQISQWNARPAAEKTAHLRAQNSFARAQYNWEEHAKEWLKLLE